MEETELTYSYRDAIDGKIPPYLMRFIKGVGRTINRYEMIRENDKVLLGISGGKDSLALALSLALRRRWLPIKYSITALLINWEEHPLTDEQKESLFEFFDRLEIPFRIKEEMMFSDGFKGEFNCYLCSRNRRRILFEEAQKEDISLIALGHHLDDLTQTTIMNLALRGHFETMFPVQDFFDKKLYVIRPLIETHENSISLITKRLQLPVVKPVCPFDEKNIRSEIQPIVKSLTKLDKYAKEHIYNSHNFSCKVIR